MAPADWADRSLEELVEHLLRAHHRPLRVEPARLAALARRVWADEGDRDPRLAALVDVVETLAQALPRLARTEAEGVFPWILAGQPQGAAGPLQAARRDHGRSAECFARLAALTDAFTPRPEASATRRALYVGLAGMAERLREHARLEDDVLLPRAFAEAAAR
jgi:regulator of cell morphogenesis and NO signaling